MANFSQKSNSVEQKNLIRLIVSVVSLVGIVAASTVAAVFTGALYPSGNGKYASWLTNSLIGASNYKMVKESPCDGLGSYVYTFLDGTKDSYQIDLSSIPVGATITSITVTPCASSGVNSGVSSTFSWFYIYDKIESPLQATYYMDPSVVTPRSLAPSITTGLNLYVGTVSTLEIGIINRPMFGYGYNPSGVRLSNIAVNIEYDVPLPPIVPNNLRATNLLSPDIVTLSWSDRSTTEDGFRIERSTNNRSFVEIGTVGRNVTNFTDMGNGLGLPAGTYYYRVRAYNAGGNSAYSSTASIVVSPPSL